MADCHIGSWREPKLTRLGMDAFKKATVLCIKNDVDFILIAGDLFNTALPGIDCLKETTSQLKKLRDKGIPVYCVPGSHDFSPSGKTMLDVLEEAGLLTNVVKAKMLDDKIMLQFTEDSSGAKITGMLGKRGTLERGFYESLDNSELEKADGFKIFILHSGIQELMPIEFSRMESVPLSLLPKGFDYYAAGHVHIVMDKHIDGYGKIAYPGPLFPNSFSEIEHLGKGGFYIYDDGELTHHKIQMKNVSSLHIDCDRQTPDQVRRKIMDEVKGKEFVNTIITLRLEGTLTAGRPSEIGFRDIFSDLYSKGAYFVMKNTAKLSSEEYEEVRSDNRSIDEIEDSLIKEQLGQVKVAGMDIAQEEKLARALLKDLDHEKQEGETITVFEERIKEQLDSILDRR